MAVTDIAAKYTTAMAWFYDTVVADAVLSSMSALVPRLGEVGADGGSFLEVGCGGGQFASTLIGRYPAVDVTGVDLSEDQIARATNRRAALSPADATRLHFQTASAADLPFPDRRFDAVFSIASIKHWPDRERAVHELVRVAKDGGVLLIADVDRGCRLEDARRFVRTVRLPAPLRPAFLWMFRTYVAGQGLDLDDARAALAGHPLTETAVERIVGTPFLLMSASKHG